MKNLDGLGIGVDPVTGAEWLTKPRWSNLQRDFERWAKDAPGLLENAIAWRLQALESGLQAEDPASFAFAHAGLELALSAKYGAMISQLGGKQ